MTTFRPGLCHCSISGFGPSMKIHYCAQHDLAEEARGDALTLQAWIKENGCTPSMMKSKCDILQGQLNEALGALGYSVPVDTPDPPRYKCGLCEARNSVPRPGTIEYEIDQAQRQQPYKGRKP